MIDRRIVAGFANALLAVGALSLNAHASAQDFPTRTVRIVSPFPGGSGPDAAARVLAERLGRDWHQSVFVEPKPGAGGFLAVESVKNGAQDGHDLLIAENGLITISPSLFKKLPFDVDRDLAPAALFFRTPFFITVAANGPIQSTAQLIAAARAAPGMLTYGTPRVGSTPHLGSAQFEALTQTKMTHVPFKETTQLFTSVATGDVSWALGTVATTGALVRSGKLKLIAVAAPSRLSSHPDVQTVAESGGPNGYEVSAWVGLFARKGTPAATLDKIQRDVAKALAEPEVRDRLAAIGYEPVVASREEFAAVIRSDTRKNAELVARTGATAD